MRALATFTVAATTALALAACGNDSTNPPPATPAAGAYPPGYPAPTAPGYPPPGYATAAPTYTAAYPQPGYPAPAPTYAPQPAPGYPPAPAPAPAPMPTAPPAATGTMATPGLLALPCSSDAICGLHHCNTQYSKCAFPCQTAVDCLAGNQCMMGVCVPGTGQ